MRFEYLPLSESVKNFLTSYSPVDDSFTSSNEINLIIVNLSLRELSGEDIIKMRNSIVEFYSNLEDGEIIYENGKFAGRTEKFWKYNTAMQSVTAVIDNCLYNMGRSDLL